jgi:hypothetical protein
MPIKTVHDHTRRHSFKLGRKRPIARGLRLSFKNYLTRSIPPPPQSADYSETATTALAEMYDNDTLGDCVIAGMAHVVGVLTGGASGQPFIYTDQQIIDLYSAIGGYDPNDPSTDQGCDEQTALNYWQDNGAPAGEHEIAGWLTVDPTDPTEYRNALYLFENLYFGFELPDEWVNPAPSSSGFIWDVAGSPDPNNGHCVVGVGYNTQGVTISTWGMTGLLTDAAIAKYTAASAGGQLYTVISQDAISAATSRAPNGFDWSQLVADFDSLGGNVTQLAQALSHARAGRSHSGRHQR